MLEAIQDRDQKPELCSQTLPTAWSRAIVGGAAIWGAVGRLLNFPVPQFIHGQYGDYNLIVLDIKMIWYTWNV